MKRYAVIDIGTLKVKSLIASTSKNGELKEIYSSNTLTCFGCEMDANEGRVLEKNLLKTINELKRVKLLLEKHNVKNFKIVSTHAMRRAKNRSVVKEKIKKEVGFKVDSISQKKEAELFFQAALRDFPENKEYAVLDMGGGSVQILIGDKHNLKKIHMMQTGAQFLHDNFTKDPSNPNGFTQLSEIEKMKRLILHELIPLKKTHNIPIVYGSSNIIDLMKAINIPLKTHNYRLKIHDFLS